LLLVLTLFFSSIITLPHPVRLRLRCRRYCGINVPHPSRTEPNQLHGEVQALKRACLWKTQPCEDGFQTFRDSCLHKGFNTVVP